MQKQKGMSFLGLLVFLFVLAEVVLLGMKLGPHYLNDYVVKKVLDEMAQELISDPKSQRQIRRDFLSKLSMNNLEFLSEKDIKITEQNNQKILDITYEVRESIISNIDANLTFNHQIKF